MQLKMPKWGQLWPETKKAFRVLVGSFYRAIGIFRGDKMQFEANALAYRTLVNIVPMLAFIISFLALLKSMSNVDLESQLVQIISRFTPSQSSGGQLLLEQLMKLAKYAKEASYLGLLLFFITSIFLFIAIEDSLNFAFKAQKRRGFFQRMVLFTAILVWGPLLVGLSIYLTATVQFQPLLAKLHTSAIVYRISIGGVFNSVFSFIEYMGTYFLSFVLIFFSLFFLYKVFPNTYVENRASAYGACFSAVFFELSKWGFGYFASGMVSARINIYLYTSFAVLLVFLIWMYLAWTVILLGAVLAYVYQYYRYELQAEPLKKKPLNRLWLAFEIMLELGARFLRGENPACVKDLAQRFSVGLPELKSVLTSLEKEHLVTRTGQQSQRPGEEQFQPARELDQIFVGQLISATDPDWKLEHIEMLPAKDAQAGAKNQFLLNFFENLKSEFDQYFSRRSLKEILVKEILAFENELKTKKNV